MGKKNATLRGCIKFKTILIRSFFSFRFFFIILKRGLNRFYLCHLRANQIQTVY